MQSKLDNLTAEQKASLIQSIMVKRKKDDNNSIPILTDSNSFPLSLEQERLWILDYLNDNADGYMIFDSYHIKGELEKDLFIKTLVTLAKKHKILSAQFNVVDRTPIQIMRENFQIPLRWYDLEEFQEKRRKEILNELMEKRIQERFDLTNDALINIDIVKFVKNSHYLLINIHHIISDGWSMELIVDEIESIYTHYHKEKSEISLEGILQFGDFASWQRKAIDEKKLTKQLDFWIKHCLPVPQLTDVPAPIDYTSNTGRTGRIERFEFNHETTINLRTLSKSKGITLFDTLLTIFGVLIYKYTDNNRFFIGIPVTNRDRIELENLIGFFVNVFPFKFAINGNENSSDLFEVTKTQNLEYYDNKNIPFEKVIDAISINRKSKENPLFNIIFQLRGIHQTADKQTAIKIEKLPVEERSARFDMEIYLVEHKDRIVGEIIYDCHKVSQKYVTNLISHYKYLSDEVISFPNKCIQQLNYQSLKSKKSILDKYAGCILHDYQQTNINSIFEHCCDEHFNKPALVYSEESISYGQLNHLATQLAARLQKRGVTKGDIIAISMGRSTDAVISILAVVKTGAVYCPLDPSLPKQRKQYILSDSDAKLLITNIETDTSFDNTYCFNLEELISSNERVIDRFPISGEDLVYVMYTSGSTGDPKGVSVKHKNVIRLVKNTNYISITDKSKTLLHSPLYFDASTFELWGALLNGGSVVIAPAGQLKIHQFEQLLKQHNITILWLTAALFNLFMQERPEAIDRLDYLLAGGDVLHPNYVDIALKFLKKGAKLINGYGPTENTTFTTCFSIDANSISQYRSIPIGKPITNTTVYILDKNLDAVPEGVVGELYTGGDGVSAGYINKPDLTKQVFISNPFLKEPHSVMYKTGDLARWLPDGNIEFVGREDDQVKLSGYRVELKEIEAALRKSELVQDAAILAYEGNDGNKELAAFIAPDRIYIEDKILGGKPDDIHHWKELFNKTYKKSNYNDGHSNFVGWESSYTREKIPEKEMREWLDNTLHRLRELEYSSVLEIGCGTGLLLFQLAPHCKSYHGTDFSDSALEYVQSKIMDNDLFKHVILEKREACDFESIIKNQFDLIILNSVIQYFPSESYLRYVLNKSIELIRPGGFIFVGDIRNYNLLNELQASLLLNNIEAISSSKTIFTRIANGIQKEEELIVSPEYFYNFIPKKDRTISVCAQPKLGNYYNELTKFRYDALMSVDPKSVENKIDFNNIEWNPHTHTYEWFDKLLKNQNDCKNIRINNIYNARTAREVLFYKLSKMGDLPLKQIKSELSRPVVGMCPQKIYDLANTHGAGVTFQYSTGDSTSFSVQFTDEKSKSWFLTKISTTNFVSNRNMPMTGNYTNIPNKNLITRELIPHIKEDLEARLPKYALPSRYIILDSLPINNNGKVDRKSLIDPKSMDVNTNTNYVSPVTQTQVDIEKFWCELLGREKIGIHDNFFDIGGNSLLLTRFIAKVNDQFDVDMNLNSFFEVPTIHSVADSIEARKNDKATIKEKIVNFTNDIRLDNSIKIIGALPTNNELKNVLLTGSTGFIGVHLLHELLESTGYTVYCLVKADSEISAYDRLKHSLISYKLWKESYKNKIVVIKGDLGKVKLDLSESRFQELCTNIDAIYHNGALVNFLYSYDYLKKPNVEGTKYLLKIATQHKVKPFHYISTLAVFSPNESGNGVALEDDPLDNGDSLSDAYAQSKWVAEKTVMEAEKRGLPVTIFRLGRIAGHSVSGCSNLNDMFSKMTKSYILTGKIPDFKTNLDITPVDYVAKTIVSISTNLKRTTNRFHICNPNRITMKNLKEAIEGNGIPIEYSSLNEWKEALASYLKRNPDETLFPLVAFYFNDDEFFKDIDISISVKNTLNEIEGKNISCPVINPELFHSYLEYMCEKKYLGGSFCQQYVANKKFKSQTSFGC